MKVAFYFPVKAQPLTMKAGLYPLGTDFGNGCADQRFFQEDGEREEYIAAKKLVNPQRHGILVNKDLLPLHLRAINWLSEMLHAELDFSPSLQHTMDPDSLKAKYNELALSCQEDIALIAAPRAGNDHTQGGQLIMTHICFPSHWSPERILGISFDEIHRPVPNFPKTPKVSKNLVQMMSTRKPMVRFVWTMSPDSHLDHHPSHIRNQWYKGLQGYLRVERQTIVPLQLGALFLIRTYRYPIQVLTSAQRVELANALRLLPENIAKYKGLASDLTEIIASLEQ